MGTYFAQNLSWYPKFSRSSAIFVKVLVYSNKEYAVLTISVNNLLTLDQNLEQARQKDPQNLPKDGYMDPGEFWIYSAFPSILPEF